MTAQVGIINLDSPNKTFPSAENRRADLDGPNFLCRNDEGVKENPRLQFHPVPVDAIPLPQTPQSAFRCVKKSLIHRNVEAVDRAMFVRGQHCLRCANHAQPKSQFSVLKYRRKDCFWETPVASTGRKRYVDHPLRSQTHFAAPGRAREPRGPERRASD